MTRDEMREALEDARDLPDGDEKIAALERLLAHADAAGDLRLGMDIRFELIEAYHDHTERWRLLPAFDWCLAAHDRDPSLFTDRHAEMLRWYHKWAVATLRSTPRVDLDETLAALDDMERRFRESGQSPQIIYNLRCGIADHLGDEAAAREWLAKWRATPPDENSDCAGCDPSRQAELLAGWGEWAEAVATVEPVLSGMVGCTEQPEKALVAIMLPHLHLGRYAEAAAAHVRAYRRHRFERDSVGYLAEHLRFCALTGHHARGLDILEEHLGWLDRPYDEASAMEFAAAGALVCRVAHANGLGARLLHRPEHGERRAAEVPLARLGADLAATARNLARRFDDRNGTDHQSQRMESWLAAAPLTTELELPPDEPDGAELTVGSPPEQWRDVLAPLTVESIAAVLDARGDRYAVDADDVIRGRWADAYLHFDRLGERQEILHTRILAARQLPADRLADALEFCNAWNHDKVFPKAYVHDTGEGQLILAGDVTTDLEHGVTGAQLAVLIHATVATATAYAAAVAALP
ncbi:Putative sensory transduction regulator [Micromonospora pattaloongensis]|uniref:Sensory transduction regulator n=1 Tax=Micromonospora pattaloongensis TaxID=405436 RepID=A0A1H3KII8_9ACTN|nr:YbjN domain-containing protein [Micromonospora pattaloongensis]SDY51438.1 Putative sensory transduction regulator [Micromonospora pattaloongensis]